MLIPNVRKTWVPVGRTPILRHSYRRAKISVISAITVSSLRQWIGLYFQCHRDNINGERVVTFLRLQIHRFPAYAPELNPDEHVWTQAKQALANGTPNTIDELQCDLGHVLFRLQHLSDKPWSCVDASELPWQ